VFDERDAIRAEQYDDGKTTTERAIEALQQPDSLMGNTHQVARAWIRNYEPHVRIFWVL
jgi:hypothetical protein